MATTAQAANPESPADSDETETPEIEHVDDQQDPGVDDEAPPDDWDKSDDAAEANALAKEGDEPADDAEKKPDEPAAAKALKDMTAEELSTQLTEDQLRHVAQKFANRTMAAARRAEKATTDVTAQNTALTGQVKVYQEFVDQFGTNPMAALRRLPGFTSLKGFVQRIIDQGGETEAPKVDPAVAALQKRLDDKEAADRWRAAEEKAQSSEANVFSALAKDPDRFDLVMTDFGHQWLWKEISSYHRKHGSCPDDKVYEMADLVEARLVAGVAKSKKFARPAQKGTTATAPAQSVAKKQGTKTITNKSSSAAPATRVYSDDEDERDRQINAEMRAAGELVSS